MASRKVFKNEKRAAFEFNVVKNCRQNYFDKLQDAKVAINELEAQHVLLIEKGKLCNSETEKLFFARDIKKIRDQLGIKNDDAKGFQDIVDLLDELITLLESFLINERFRYIVKKIPEKKLPKMIRNPQKQNALTDLLISLLNDFYAAQEKYLHALKERQAKRTHLMKVKTEFRERNDEHDADISNILNELNDSTQEVEVVQNHENYKNTNK